MQVVDKVKGLVRFTFRSLRMTAIHKVFRRLKRSGVNPELLDTLEVFGCDGEHHTRDVASIVAHLEIWEFSSKYEPILKSRFPKAEIKITDSYVEIQRTTKKHNLVLVDNSEVAHGQYEHFDLFPAVLQVLAEPAILVLHVSPLCAR